MNIQNQIAKIQNSALTDPRFKQNEELPITDNALDGVNKLFNSILPHFPGWRQACPTDDDLSRLKLVWTKALMRNKQKTGKSLDLKAGITACEESETDWLPSVGKFIKWCEQSNDLTQFAERAYNLFIKREQQIDTVGKMVTANHAFDLRKMNSKDCEKGFIEHYLRYAQDNAIEPLEAFALTNGVQLSPEQQKEAEKRNEIARNECLDSLHSLFGKPEPKVTIESQKTGLITGRIKTHYKSPKQLDDERERQLRAIKDKL